MKPSNIMLDEDFEVRLGDFGLAKSMGLSRQTSDLTVFPNDDDSDRCDATSACGTLGYMVPEEYASDFNYYSRKSDVFGFGVTLLQLVMGKPVCDRSIGRR
ncbi:hypothetical protein MLD38_028819 [Melastoma candidum]|uniref:Uncharacterized protein n=1 Tax=Melastoma candidum TaxID=119954 RepID=A0ACB9N304_9MYRT|nr:hypothetical protein MLD38_028819 [Melastoma candidum]